ncbi:hypothetical protein [Yinghuangia soli]|uniref:HEAT repeat domain-containing protein n=1 Tax=Yinghuangia soli TaxID=2908204 RepID=A0AA41Q1M4_9ACTN|nr:hypothetical protein [Yinghuangia soli]MCF2529913.1 hypothetical protein [Yinghuangia soli]
MRGFGRGAGRGTGAARGARGTQAQAAVQPGPVASAAASGPLGPDPEQVRSVIDALAATGFPRDEAAPLLGLLREAVPGPDAARDAAADVLAALPAALLVELDALARPADAVGTLGTLKERRALLRTSGAHPAVAALLSLDENGGLREEAVVRLASMPGPVPAAMLALRTDDWAGQVRHRARVALMWRLDPDEAAVVVPMLDLRRGRARAEGILDVYRDAYRAEHLPTRRHGHARDLAASRTPQLRRFGHELARGLGIADEKALLRIALKDPDHSCRAAAGHELLRRARGRHRDRTALALLKVADPMVRERAVEALPPCSDPFPLAGALADRSPNVRAAARRRLVAGGTDPAGAYRSLLELPPSAGLVPGLLIGLGECGGEEDLAELHERFDAEHQAQRRAARAGAVLLTRAWLPAQGDGRYGTR